MTRRRWWWEWRAGRVRGSVDLTSLNRPLVHFAAEQHDGNDWGYVAVSYGNGNSDPVVSVEIDLGGTKVGHGIFVVYWTVTDWLDRRKKRAAG